MKVEFPISEKIYTALLGAFPKSHREKYGAAMTQLFRDQCRDAWAEAGNFGLLKLWLRALPDLAGSSIWERLAALKERKTMNDNLANLSAFQNYSPGKTFVRVFIPVFLIVVLVSTAVTFILPEIYASTATVRLESEVQPHPGDDAMAYSDPYFVQTTFEIMKSELVLTNVISALNLNDTWGRKYNAGEPLKTVETMEILKNRMGLAPVKNTKMISITVYDDDKNEAAALANQIAKSYQQYREQNSKRIQAAGVKVLEEQLESASNQLQATMPAYKAEERRYAQLKSKTEMARAGDGSDLKNLEVELEVQSNQVQIASSQNDDTRQLYTLLLSKEKMAKIDYQMPYNMVQITDPAEPGRAPVKPNKPLNITLGVFGGIVLASIVGLLVLAVKAIARRKTGAVIA